MVSNEITYSYMNYEFLFYFVIAIYKYDLNVCMDSVFSCDQAALRTLISVCLSVCPSVRLSVCLSVRPSFRPAVRHTFLTMFLSSYHPEIFRIYYHWQTWCPCKRSRSKVKVIKVMTPFSRFRTVTPVWINILWWNDAQSLMLLRRGALLFFKVIRQISRSHGTKKS